MFMEQFSWRTAKPSKTAKINHLEKFALYGIKAYGAECNDVMYREDYGNKDKTECMVIINLRTQDWGLTWKQRFMTVNVKWSPVSALFSGR